MILSNLLFPFKGQLLFRIGARLTQLFGLTNKGRMVMTNLGMKQEYKMSMPLDSPVFVFGNPKTYLGERGVLYLSQHLATSVDVVMDVGANWGYFTYFLRNGLDNKTPIYYFEPNDKLFKVIGQNIKNNNLPNIYGFQKGISSYSGTASFFINLTNDLSSTLDGSFMNPGEQLLERTIEVISFDDFASKYEQEKKWLVKVDIENAEMEFIKGATKKMDQIEFLIIELLEKARKAKLADQLTRQFGFYAYYINDFNLEHMPKEDGRYTAPEYNFLFCRLTPDELEARMTGTLFKVSK